MTSRKVDFGMRCTRCGHKIPDRSLLGKDGSRIEKSGVCGKCNDEYYGAIRFELPVGKGQYPLQFIEYVGNYAIHGVVPVIGVHYG
jgi:hypothetical protein